MFYNKGYLGKLQYNKQGKAFDEGCFSWGVAHIE